MSLETESGEIFSRIIEDLQHEAQASVELIRELAGLEEYIAETYAQRCLAELFQNSDDCDSSKAAILRFNDCLVYANNGRPFDVSDFRSLCKSALSSKERGKSIGYRGIGFKSVVNICNNVIVSSGDLRCCFDRNRTENLLSCYSGVPLVRVPHLLTEAEYSLCCEISQRLPGYRTYFIFRGLNEQSIDQELSGLSPEHFLFLRNLTELSIDFANGTRFANLRINRDEPDIPTSSDLHLSNVAINSDLKDSQQIWVVARKNNISLAVKSVDNIPSRALKHEAIVHAYLPTQTISSLGVRVNADFSTDPSRTRLKYDDRTNQEIEQASLLILDVVKELLYSPESLFWRSFVDAIIPYPEYKILEIQGNKFCSTLLSYLGSETALLGFEKFNLRLLPEAYRDIESMASRLPSKLNVFLPVAASYSDAKRFLEVIGAKRLTLAEVLEFHSHPENAIDINACPIFLRNVASGDFDINALKSVYTFVDEEENVLRPLDFIEMGLILSPRFLGNLSEIFLSQKRAKYFLESLGFSHLHFGNAFHSKQGAKVDINSLVNRGGTASHLGPPMKNSCSSNSLRILDDETKRRYGINNWRLSEEVVAYYYRSQGYKVIDVSQANKGFDLEVIGDSSRLCVEVKDIKDSTKGFSLTQNEYTEADLLGDAYVLALVRRGVDEVLEIMFIANPGRSLQAFTTKRAKAYEFLITGFSFSPDVSFS